ncbi:hypothetical protein DEO72_LG6g1051 [Vigna unguiculata]|uniref:Uncharacterized protein n=1 Tax=Vigna unguiculata TaxID=3917 RepID=A0A4D6M4S5_VIGUN|nr:hypothetical protein DEO72_LG6g1051 [Vigna unguiculata]
MQQNGNQTCYDSSFNTLRLDSTHPDTYNSVGFSGCLHLWWIPLLDLELLDPELCVTSVTMNQNLSHHKSYPNKSKHKRTKTQSNITLSRPNPSLRLKGLAQARQARSGEPPLRLGEGSRKTGPGQHGISLKRDPSRLGELPARSKVERAAWATFRAINLGELPVSSRLGEMDSLGRD